MLPFKLSFNNINFEGGRRKHAAVGDRGGEDDCERGGLAGGHYDDGNHDHGDGDDFGREDDRHRGLLSEEGLPVKVDY